LNVREAKALPTIGKFAVDANLETIVVEADAFCPRAGTRTEAAN
jgi:hypothetical protein